MSKGYGMTEDQMLEDFINSPPDPKVIQIANTVWAQVVAEVERRRRVAHAEKSVAVMTDALRRIAQGARNQGPHTGMGWHEVEKIAAEALAFAEDGR